MNQAPVGSSDGNEGRSTNWRTPMLEGLAVLAGILLAFGIDAWWGHRSDRAQEQSYLEALRAELVDARADFTGQTESLASQVTQAGLVVEALRSPEVDGVSTDSLSRMIASLGPPGIFLPARAALDDLVSSGGLTLIRSDTLRRTLARYRQALATDLAVQERLEDLWLTHRAPYRYQHSTMNPIVDGETQRLGLILTVDRQAYVSDRTYGNLVVARMLRMDDVRRAHRETVGLIDDLLSLLGDL